MLQIMSNGIFKSPIHRVVTDSERGRMSLAVFCLPNPNQEVGPVNGVVNEARPRLYKTVKDYTSIFYSYFEKGTRPIESAKIQISCGLLRSFTRIEGLKIYSYRQISRFMVTMSLFFIIFFNRLIICVINQLHSPKFPLVIGSLLME